jgi:tRNA 2-thiouridine synthesizing protein A
MADYTLDARYMLCPLPVLRAGKMLGKMKSGDRLMIQGTDPDGLKEFELFCQDQTDIKIIRHETTKTGWHVCLQISA